MLQFEGFFKVRKNIIFERVRFNRRNQLEGEMAEKLDGCEYAGLKEETDSWLVYWTKSCMELHHLPF